MVIIRYISFYLLLLVSAASFAIDYEITYEEPVIDFTNTLTDQEIERFNERIREFTLMYESQIAVVIIPSTDGEPIEDVSMQIASEWQLGRKGIDDGVLFLIAKNDRKMRIEVGYGLEGAITDANARRIINEVGVEFKSGYYANGIDVGLEYLMTLIKGENLPRSEYNYVRDFIIIGIIFNGLLVGFFFASRRWWRNRTNGCNKKSFLGKVAYVFMESRWEFLAYGIQTILLVFFVSLKSPTFWESFKIGGTVSSFLFFGYYFFSGLGTGDGSGSSSSSSGGGSSSSSYSGGGGSFGGGGASGGW